MDRRGRSGSGIVIGVIAVIAIGGFLYLRNAESDYTSSPIDVGPGSGNWVVVEPGDEFTVGLFAHPVHTAAAWTIAAREDTVIEVVTAEHLPRASTPPDEHMRSFMSPAMQELWSNLPDPGRPPDYEAEGEGSFWYWPLTAFGFAGGTLGESDVVLELRVEGELLDSFEFRVSVVEDACEYFVGQESSTKVPHRCG